MKRIPTIAIILIVGFISGWTTKTMMRPPYPSHWDAVKVGMTPEEAKGAVPTLDTSLREIKGFDQTVDFGDRYWSLLVIYDDSGRVREISKNYIDRPFGLLNYSIREPTR